MDVKKRGPKPAAVGGVKTFVNKRWMVSRTVMILCALDSPYLGQPFKYLGHRHITHRIFFITTWSWKMPQKLTKTQKFRESQMALKNKILSFARFLKLSFISTVRNITIWCSLESPDIGWTVKKFLEPLEVEKRKKKWPKLRNFESLSWLWKTRFGLLRVFWNLASLLRFTMSWFDVC